MRRRADWMTRNDDAILELLATAEPLALPPKVIHWNSTEIGTASMVKQTVDNRLEKLVAAGLIRRVRDSGAYYQLTEAGQQYLDGDLEPEPLPS